LPDGWLLPDDWLLSDGLLLPEVGELPDPVSVFVESALLEFAGGGGPCAEVDDTNREIARIEATTAVEDENSFRKTLIFGISQSR
jgi:hypothetical protein